jgi:TonB-linked SusC/RagA family outer membrane protein
MKKIRLPGTAVSKSGWRKIALIMKLTFAFTFLLCMQLSAKVHSQTTVTLRLQHTALSKVFLEIEKRTDFRFLFNDDLTVLGTKVDINVKDKPVAELLTQLLMNSSLDYRIVNERLIVITDRSKEERGSVITGQIYNAAGQPVSGVSVMEKGTQNGTTTNERGEFSLTVSDKNAVLVVSSVGYQPQDFPLRGQSSITVNLAESTSRLNDIVVVGYGSQVRKSMTTAVSKVSGKDVNGLIVSTPGDALTGLAAGVQVQDNNGSYPGQPPIIRIRGVGSLNASGNEPLYVVDGYPLPNVNQFQMINATDIESIEVLKDAASAAIYGSRASGGVVLVTTKKGRSGKTQFQFDAYTGVQQVAHRVKMMNSEQYVAYAKEAAGVRGVQYPTIFNRPSDWAHTDWQDAIFRTAPMTRYDLSATGGTNSVRYFISGNYLSQTGSLVGTDYKLASIRMNLDADVARHFRVGVNMSPSYSVQHLAAVGGTFNGTGTGGGNSDLSVRTIPDAVLTALMMPPIIPKRYANGNYGQVNGDSATSAYGFMSSGLLSPLAILNEITDKAQNYRLLGNMYVEWEPLKGLKLKSQGGSSLELIGKDIYVPPTVPTGEAPAAGFTNPVVSNIYSSTYNNRIVDWIWENTANYTRKLGKHTLSGFFLYSLQKYQSELTQVYGTNGTFISASITNPTASTADLGTLGYSLNSFASLAGRVNYDYDGKYLFTAALRNDGSSKFGANNKFGNFPSVSAAWRISEEHFMKQVTFLSELKVRASYGQTGNANIGDFTGLSSVTPSNYSFGGTRQFGVRQNGFANNNLTWEKQNQTDLGLEAGFLNDRIYFTMDLYRKTTEGYLTSKPLPAILGYATSYQTNVGRIRNDGIELGLNTRNITSKKFSWTTDFNFSYTKNKVLDLGGVNSLGTSGSAFGWNNVYSINVGRPLGQIYGFKLNGIFRNQADLTAGPRWYGGSKIGDLRGMDVNHDGVVDLHDTSVLGNGFPPMNFGITNRLTYGDFDLSFIIQGTLGGSIINADSRFLTLPQGQWNGFRDMVNNYFIPSDPTRNVKYPIATTSGLANASVLTSMNVYNGSFVRMRNVTFGYHLPAAILSRTGLQSLRAYISAENLVTITKYPFYNPEPSMYGGTVNQPGSDQGGYPLNRILTIGLSVGF